MSDKVKALHPDPEKEGTNIDRTKYETIKTTILEILDKEGSVTFTQLSTLAKDKLRGTFEGSIGWYVTTVKLDLEAREILHVDRGSSPQVITKSN